VLLCLDAGVCAVSSGFASESIVLLGVTHVRLRCYETCKSSRIECLKHNDEGLLSNLDYNQLKRVLLRVLADNGPLDSDLLLQTLSSSGGVPFEIHAVRMALMRYYRQGLLKRVRSGGQFTYSLTDRGIRRLEWLEGQAEKGKPS